MKKFVIEPIGGLANRLRALFSAKILAEKYNYFNTGKVKLLVGICLLFSFFLTFQYDFFDLYDFFGFQIGKHFGDLNNLLFALEDFEKGGNPYLYRVKEDIAIYNYPSFFRIFSVIPIIKPENLYAIGFFLFFTSMAFTILIVDKINLYRSLILLLALASPAFILAVERGNSDLIIYLILSTSIIFYHRYSSVLLILFTGMLKIFPFAGIVFLIGTGRGKALKTNIILLLFSSILILIYLYLIKDELSMISKNTPYSLYGLCFGYRIIPETLLNKFFENRVMVYILYILFTILFSYIYIVFISRNKNSIQSNYIISESSYYSFLLGSLIFSFSYFIGISWDYRKIFILFLFPFLLQNHRNRLCRLSLIFCMIILWGQLFLKLTSIFIYGKRYLYIWSENLLILLLICNISLIIYKNINIHKEAVNLFLAKIRLLKNS